MAIYNGPKCRCCRRESVKLFLKGNRCFTDKCAVERRNYPPGQHGQLRKRQISKYGMQLREKQKTRRIYGILESQFRNYFKKAAREMGVTGDALMKSLELRLDNVVFRMGFAPCRRAARQLVLHNHFLLNGKKVNVPSLRLKAGDEVVVKEQSKEMEIIHGSLKSSAKRQELEWLSVDKVHMKGNVLAEPLREQIPSDVREQLIVELYSK